MAFPLRIVVIGSSTAEGVGAHPADMAWVALYQAYLKDLHPENEVINLGLGGLQTFQLVPTGHRPLPARPLPDPERNISRALAMSPDAVIVNAPSNDAAAGYGPEEQLANFDAMIQTAEAAGVPVWIGTPQPRNFEPELVRIQLRLKEAVLQRYGERAINLWDGLATSPGTLAPSCDAGDGTHLNNKGHRVVYEQVVDRDIPKAVAQWKSDEHKRQRLKPGASLHVPALTAEVVDLEIYDDQAILRFRARVSLPFQTPASFGPAGVYWVRIAGNTFYRFAAWVKTTEPA